VDLITCEVWKTSRVTDYFVVRPPNKLRDNRTLILYNRQCTFSCWPWMELMFDCSITAFRIMLPWSNDKGRTQCFWCLWFQKRCRSLADVCKWTNCCVHSENQISINLQDHSGNMYSCAQQLKPVEDDWKVTKSETECEKAIKHFFCGSDMLQWLCYKLRVRLSARLSGIDSKLRRSTGLLHELMFSGTELLYSTLGPQGSPTASNETTVHKNS